MRVPRALGFLPATSLLVIVLVPPARAGDALWTQTALTSPTIESLVFTSNGTLVAGTDGNGVQVSADSGATWNDHSVGLPAGSKVFDLKEHSATGEVYAATRNGVWRTTTFDGGSI